MMMTMTMMMIIIEMMMIAMMTLLLFQKEVTRLKALYTHSDYCMEERW
jgi:hypothetical protein